MALSQPRERPSTSFPSSVLGPAIGRVSREVLASQQAAMEEEEAEGPALPHDCLYYPMDLYNSEDRLPLLPEPTGHPAELGRAVSSRAPPHFREDPEELARLYELADAEALGDGSVGDGALQAGSSEFVPYALRKTQTALKQRNWRPGGEAVGPEDPGWGLTGACQELREAYYYTHGRASEEYECYVIPEEEDEEEAPNGFCVTCRIPVVGSAMMSEEHREHEVTPLSKALEGARVSWSEPLLHAVLWFFPGCPSLGTAVPEQPGLEE